MYDGNVTTPEGQNANAAAAQSSSFYSLDGLKAEFTAVGDRAKKILDPMRQLESSGEQLVETFGYAGERLKVMETQINSSATSILGLSKNAKTYEEAMKRAGEIIKEVSVATNRNVIVSSEVIKSLELTAEATGVKTSDLAKNFGDVGIQLSDVQNKMEIATSVAQKMGVNVGAVAKGVSDNLKNLTIYNFQNGVEGLAKMVAKSAVLGVNMEHVFTMAEKAFDPDQAVELAADMQRLGVATSDLLDPLKIMDLGQNNPEELMNQMVNVTKGLTTIDEKSGQVKILPGEMGRMRELAKAMGMSAKELAEMAIKSGELEYKMKKIQFPELKAPMDEKTREMIANLASFKEGEGFVVDVGGEIKQVSTLSEKDIKLLEEQAQPKTMEQYAQDQLTVSQKIFKTLEFIASAPRSGLARGQAGQQYRRDMDKYADAFRTGAFKKDENKEDFHDKMAKDLNAAAEEILTNLPKNMFEAITESMPKPGEEFDIKKFQEAFEKVFTESGTKLEEKVKGVGGSFGELFKGIALEVLKVQPGKQIPKLPDTPKTTTSSTETKSEPSLNWHETLDKTMESYKKSMEPKTTTTPTEKTPEQIEEEKQKQDTEAMEDLFSSFVEKTGTPIIDMKPLIENGMAQNDRLIEKLDELIAAVNENKLAIDYDKLGVNVNEDTEYTNLFEPMINKFSELISSQRETISALEKIKSIDFTKQIEIPEKIEEPLIVENKVETPPITETPKIEITNEPFNLPEPLNMDDMLTSFNDLGEKFKFPSTDFSPIMDRYGFETDKILDKFTTLIEATKENEFNIDYTKFTTGKNEEKYSQIFEPTMNKLGQFISEQERIFGVKTPEPTKIEKTELIKETTKEIEVPRQEIKQPEILIKPEYELGNNAPIGVQNIKESNLPESAKTTIPEITPQTMKTESTTNVGGEITLVVDVRGVQNDASRLIIDEVTKKINSGEFTTALISQIKNKESAYGQLSGNQYSTPPGFV